MENDSNTALIQIHDYIFKELTALFGFQAAEAYTAQFTEIVEELRTVHAGKVIHGNDPCLETKCFNSSDAVLITYGNTILPDSDETPLASLANFLNEFIGDAVSTIHILPFYPYSSDDGFSIIDYLEVDKTLGSWADIERIGTSYTLMMDLVINHISKSSDWFTRYLSGDDLYRDYFIETEPAPELSNVFRPRVHPLLTEFDTWQGKKHLWTTFSDDQIDLNYQNPAVLLRMLEVLQRYIIEGASLIRLDAVAFIWKEIGTRCLHHPNTHRIIRLIRYILDSARTGTHLITETNVPHHENISYFGNGHDEASMVYNFALPPLTLHAFMTGDSTYLTNWAEDLEFPSQETAYFNFLASHDGIGLMAVSDILPKSDVKQLAKTIHDLGGFVSSKSEPDGSETPYELNCTFLDALKRSADEKISTDLEAARFMASQSIMLTLRGVPGIYIHSILGSGNWNEGPGQTGMARSINREKLIYSELQGTLRDTKNLKHKILNHYLRLLTVRAEHEEFSPSNPQEVLRLNDKVFAIRRHLEQEKAGIVCLTNISHDSVSVQLPLGNEQTNTVVRDLFSGKSYCSDNSGTAAIDLQPYQVIWIQEY